MCFGFGGFGDLFRLFRGEGVTGNDDVAVEAAQPINSLSRIHDRYSHALPFENSLPGVEQHLFRAYEEDGRELGRRSMQMIHGKVHPKGYS